MANLENEHAMCCNFFLAFWVPNVQVYLQLNFGSFSSLGSFLNLLIRRLLTDHCKDSKKYEKCLS